MGPPEYDFRVEYAEGRLALREGLPLPAEVRDYLSQYLEKLSARRPIGFHRGSPVYSLYQTPPASRAGERALRARLQRRFAGARIPAVATLALNRACQCRCEHCSASDYNRRRAPELSTQIWREAVAQSAGLGATQLIFVGGEPLLRRDLSALLRSIDSNAARAILFTNGEYLGEAWAQTLPEQGLMGAFVSLDSVRAEEHDRLRRRPGLFEKAVAGIRLWRGRGVLMGLSSYLSPARLAAGIFEEMMELGRELGVNEVTFFDAIPSGTWLHREDCLLQAADREKIRRLVRSYRRKDGYPGISAQSLLTSGEGGAFCFAANTQFYLSAGGEMCPCDFTPLSVGRFPEESLETLWRRLTRSPPYRCRAKACRMQDREFRRRWIETIPPGAALPWPLAGKGGNPGPGQH